MLKITRPLAVAGALALAFAVAPAANAQEPQNQMHGMGRSTMHGGMTPGGSDRQPMDRDAMHGGMGMMCPMMHSGMMQGGMMGHEMGSGSMGGGMGALFGSRVTPVMNLSVDDVRGYLSARLERLNNKRLKIGDINSGDGTITADIVTADNSLVQRMKVDRHTGAISYEN